MKYMKNIGLSVVFTAGLMLVSPSALAAGADSQTIDPIIFRIAVFVLAAFVGYYVVWAVTPALHTPLMSVTNAISAVVVVGAIVAAAASAIDVSDAEIIQKVWTAKWLGAGAVALACVNIFGGFMVTNRMLSMYKKKSKPAQQATQE